MRNETRETQETPDGGTWYLAQVADGAWRIQVRSAAEVSPRRVLDHLSGYPAVVTTNGNLFYLGTSLLRLAASRAN